MALASERVYGRRVVVADFLLLSVVAHAHADMVVAPIAPDVEGELKTRDEDALVYLSRSISKCMLP